MSIKIGTLYTVLDGALLGLYDYPSFPQLVRDDENSLFYLFYDHRQNHSATDSPSAVRLLKRATSAAVGSPWSDPIEIVAEDGAPLRAFLGASLLAANGDLLVVTGAIDVGPPYAAVYTLRKSTDQGESWSTVSTVLARFTDPSHTTCLFEFGGNLYSAQYASISPNYQSGLVVSADGGVNWAVSDMIWNGGTDSTLPEEPVAIVLSDGSLLVLTRDDSTPAFAGETIRAQRVTAIGGTWPVPGWVTRGLARPGMCQLSNGAILVVTRNAVTQMMYGTTVEPMVFAMRLTATGKVVHFGKPAFFGLAGRGQEYGDAKPYSANQALVVWADESGPGGTCMIRECLVRVS
jgi:hypothetical protein